MNEDNIGRLAGRKIVFLKEKWTKQGINDREVCSFTHTLIHFLFIHLTIIFCRLCPMHLAGV